MRLKWKLREAAQRLFPRTTLAVLAHGTWVLEPEVALLPLLSKRKGMAVDAGANKGVYLFHLSKHFESVFAFEPLPAMAEYLKRAAPANARVEAAALSSKTGQAQLRLPRGFNELGTLNAQSPSQWGAEVEVHDVALGAARHVRAAGRGPDQDRCGRPRVRGPERRAGHASSAAVRRCSSKWRSGTLRVPSNGSAAIWRRWASRGSTWTATS